MRKSSPILTFSPSILSHPFPLTSPKRVGWNMKKMQRDETIFGVDVGLSHKTAHPVLKFDPRYWFFCHFLTTDNIYDIYFTLNTNEWKNRLRGDTRPLQIFFCKVCVGNKCHSHVLLCISVFFIPKRSEGGVYVCTAGSLRSCCLFACLSLSLSLTSSPQQHRNTTSLKKRSRTSLSIYLSNTASVPPITS
ncbi:hypothetical protein F5Y17DRAFT_146746 [Xylariaceae sp. FL0594]|nr:hypothetical protein F5Y17DRAFT_146746 [Xylariaceae sp. FL0594]